MDKRMESPVFKIFKIMKTVLVTGANRGIGLEIVKQLDHKGFTIIMGCRNVDQNLKINHELSEKVHIMQLDVTDDFSVKALSQVISNQFGVLDILINNAGISEYPTQNRMISGLKQKMMFYSPTIYNASKRVALWIQKGMITKIKHTATNVSIDHVKMIMDTNLFGVWRVTQAMIPLLKKSCDPRVINMSSGLGSLYSLTGYYPGYSISKASLNALTLMFAKELENDRIKVNAMCPGWVKTDMGGLNAPRTVQEGADTAVWLAIDPDIKTGKLYQDRTIINW